MSKPPILTPFLDDADVILYAGDCIDVMSRMPEASVDAIITDPPYGLEFMGKNWDGFGTPLGFQTWTEAWAREAFRVLKPGGHLLAFAGTRTYHRMASGVEDAGFKIRDCIAWMYGSGFPKSLDVSKAIDKAAGAKRIRVIEHAGTSGSLSGPRINVIDGGDPVTAAAAAAWSGWGTALKPAFEPIVVARKPLGGTVAANVLEHGTGALNIDGCRIAGAVPSVPQPVYGLKHDGVTSFGAGVGRNGEMSNAAGGRWPANVVLDDAAAELLDAQSGERAAGANPPKHGLGSAAVYGEANRAGVTHDRIQLDAGGASRFYYTAKASRQDRNTSGADNTHPTVKPTELMRWLIRLVTPPGGIILDPFGGSGSTGVAARAENVRCILIEREEEYLEIIRNRLAQQNLFATEHRND